jgi:hypothetical protein
MFSRTSRPILIKLFLGKGNLKLHVQIKDQVLFWGDNYKNANMGSIKKFLLKNYKARKAQIFTKQKLLDIVQIQVCTIHCPWGHNWEKTFFQKLILEKIFLSKTSRPISIKLELMQFILARKESNFV